MQTEIDCFLADLDAYERGLEADIDQLPVLLRLDLKPNVLMSYSVSDTELKFSFNDNSCLVLKDYHEQDCCESVYADWSYIKPFLGQDFKPSSWKHFEILGVIDAGFVIRLSYLSDKLAVFVPCYNVQNGYYSNDLTLTISYGDNCYTVNLTDYTKEDIG